MKSFNLLLILIALSLNALAQNMVIERPGSGTGAFYCSSEGGPNLDVFVADDFVLTEETILGEMDFWGFLNGYDYCLESFNIIIYEDLGGEPASNPTQLGDGIVEIRNIPLDIIDIEIDVQYVNFLNIPITQANDNNQISLDAGTYWFCAFATFTYDSNNSSTLLSWAIDHSPIPDEGSHSRQYFTSTNEWRLLDPIGSSYSTIAFALRDEALVNTKNIENKLEKTKIYSNPVLDEIRVEFPDDISTEGELQILSVDGRVVDSKPIEENHSNELSFNVSHLSKGLYIVKLKFEKTFLSQKIIIK